MLHHNASGNHGAGRLPGVSARRAACLSAAIALANLIGLSAAAAPQKTVLHAFKGGADGGNPSAGLIMDANGALDGTTAGGGAGKGTVFELTPPAAGTGTWTEKVLYAFKGGADGGNPSGGVIMDAKGRLYGTTESGGFGNNGTVFELTPLAAGTVTWTEKVLYRFSPFEGFPDGANPPAGLIMDARGSLYGTTEYGGVGRQTGGISCGTVFELTPPAAGGTRWTEKLLYAFEGKHRADGALPFAGLIMDANGAVYGTTWTSTRGGCHPSRCGTVFKLVL
jgi:uncharacterized repeat protein (TIGR03803 family)